MFASFENKSPISYGIIPVQQTFIYTNFYNALFTLDLFNRMIRGAIYISLTYLIATF